MKDIPFSMNFDLYDGYTVVYCRDFEFKIVIIFACVVHFPQVYWIYSILLFLPASVIFLIFLNNSGFWKIFIFSVIYFVPG